MSNTASKETTTPPPLKPAVVRKPRLLWANPFCLVDTSSGASLAAREILRQLVFAGYEVEVIGATVFDNPRGISRIAKLWENIQQKRGQWVSVDDEPLKHVMLSTASTDRGAMTCHEEGLWIHFYMEKLDTFKPDLVFLYGGQNLEMLATAEARARGIPTAAYLVNPHYSGTRWCQDIDLIISDSKATSEMYKHYCGYKVETIGAFIEPSTILASEPSRRRVLAVNPTLEKGGIVVAQLAMLLERKRPDIIFEVVEARGSWVEVVKMVTASAGEMREQLSNVILTGNTYDMRPVYGRARLILLMSMWWESFPRTLIEAMMNGIPPIISNRGGLPEAAADAGFIINFSNDFYEKPFNKLANVTELEKIADLVIRAYDDETFYQEWVMKALSVGHNQHKLSENTQRLLAVLKPYVDRRAGDQDFDELMKEAHKQKLSRKPRAVEKKPKVDEKKNQQPETKAASQTKKIDESIKNTQQNVAKTNEPQKKNSAPKGRHKNQK